MSYRSKGYQKRKLSAETRPIRTSGLAVSYWSPYWHKWIFKTISKPTAKRSPKQIQSQNNFKYASWLTKNISADFVGAAMDEAVGTPFLWRDLIMLEAYGKLTEMTDNFGTTWKGRRVLYADIQLLLSSIGIDKGSLLIRTNDGWVELLPGPDGNVLKMDPSTRLPTWGPADTSAQPANEVYAGPASGPDAVPAFRHLVNADLPTPAPIGANLFESGPSSGPPATPTYRPIVAADLPAPAAVNANLVEAGPPSGGPAAPTFRALVLSDIPAPAAVNANLLEAGPTSGGPATPTFRALVSADIPTLPISKIGNASANKKLIGSDHTGSGAAYTELSISNLFDIPASTLDLAAQAANLVLAGPSSGAAAVPTARALVSADIPTLPISKIGNASASKLLLGSGASGSGAHYDEITLGTGLDIVGTQLKVNAVGGVFDNAMAHLAGAFNTSVLNAWGKIPIDTVDWDTGSLWNAANKRFIPTRAGYYMVTGRVRVNTAINNAVAVAIALNGTISQTVGNDPSTSVSIAVGGATMVHCNGTTDYIELFMYQSQVRTVTATFLDTYLGLVGPF